MPVIHYDIETRSALNLRVAGVHRYASDSTTEILCIAFTVDDDPAVDIWVPSSGEPIPKVFIEAERDASYSTASHNDQFERTIERLILHPRYGWPLIPLERRRCSMG